MMDTEKTQLVKELETLRARVTEYQTQLREQTNGVPIPTYTWQRAGKDLVLIGYNDAAKAITRGEITHLLGTKASETYHDTPEILDDFSQCLTEQTVVRREMVYRLRSTGESRYLIASYVFIPPDTVLVHTEDITEHKRVEEALRESEKRFRSIVEQSIDGIVLSDEQGIVIEWNRSMERLAGLKQVEAIGRPLWDIQLQLLSEERRTPEESERLKVFVQQFLTTGQAPWMGRLLEVNIRHPDGTLRSVQQSTFSIETDKGFMPCGIFRDVTEQKRAEADREAARKLLQATVDGVGEPLLLVGLDYQIKMMNRAVRDKYLAGNGTGPVYCYQVSHHRDSPCRGDEHPCPLDRVRETLRPVTVTHEHVRQDGEKRLVEIVATPLLEESGALGGIVEAARDVTERKQAEEELEQYHNHLEELVKQRTVELEAANEHLLTLTRLKDEFVSNVSHELRTPITNLKLHLHLLSLCPEEKRRRHMTTLEREARRLENLVESLLFLSRLDQDRVDFQLSPLDFNALVESYVLDRQALATSRDLTLTFHPTPECLPVQADEQQIGQVLSIFMTNAFHYTPAGGQVIIRTLTQRRNRARWAGFSVSDTGPGIPPEEQDLIFTRFFRGKVGRKSGAPGIGLGLAIAQEIVERHQGRIEVGSEEVPGKGATFTVWLPMDRERVPTPMSQSVK